MPPRCRCMRWGLCRAWEKTRSSPFQVFNARAEGVLVKPTFSPLMARGRRCVVPIDGFYEFKSLENNAKQPYYLFKRFQKQTPSRQKDDHGDTSPQLLLAGLWDTWVDPSAPAGAEQVLYSVTLLTMDASSDISWLHHRQPCIMDVPTARRWLDRRCDPEDVLSSMRHACRAPKLAWHRVSNEMNKTTYQQADCATHIDQRKGAITSFFGAAASNKMKAEDRVVVSSNIMHHSSNRTSTVNRTTTSSNSGGATAGRTSIASSMPCTNKKMMKKRPRNSITSFFQRSPQKNAKKKKKSPPSTQSNIIHHTMVDYKAEEDDNENAARPAAAAAAQEDVKGGLETETETGSNYVILIDY